MKKLIVVALFLSVVLIGCATRQPTVAELLETAVSKLGNPVPAGFQRMGATAFINDVNIVLVALDGIVSGSTFGRAFDTTHEASALTGSFYDHFEANRNWTLYRSAFVAGGGISGTIFSNCGTYAFIGSPTLRDDGLIVASVAFAKNIRDF